METGVYRTIPGGEGRYFFPTRVQAENFQRLMQDAGMDTICVTSGCIPTELLRGIEIIHPAGEGSAYLMPEGLLPYFRKIITHG